MFQPRWFTVIVASLFASLSPMLAAAMPAKSFLCKGDSIESVVYFDLTRAPEVTKENYTTVFEMRLSDSQGFEIVGGDISFSSDQCFLSELSMHCEHKTPISSKRLHMSRLTGSTQIETFDDENDTFYVIVEKELVCKNRSVKTLF